MTITEAKENKWKRLAEVAAREVKAVIASLPKDLRQRAEAIPMTMEVWPGRKMRKDGVEPDTMGLFIGADFEHETDGRGELPPEMIFFLGNIWDEVEQDMERFKVEVRKTLLHELGHYLGLDEKDLEERELE